MSPPKNLSSRVTFTLYLEKRKKIKRKTARARGHPPPGVRAGVRTGGGAFLAPPLGSNRLVFNSPPVIYHNILFSPVLHPLKRESVLHRLPFLVLFCAVFNGGYFLLRERCFFNKKVSARAEGSCLFYALTPLF